MRGNGPMMQQALQNLIINGIRYNRSIEPCVKVSGESVDGHCIITVEDNGIGIAEEYRETVFKPLARLHTLGIPRHRPADAHAKPCCRRAGASGLNRRRMKARASSLAYRVRPRGRRSAAAR